MRGVWFWVAVAAAALAALLLYLLAPGIPGGGSGETGHRLLVPEEIRGVIGGAHGSSHIRVESFDNGSWIPDKYTCMGRDANPAVAFEVPGNTVSVAIIMYDPDAPRGVFYHWAIYNVEPDAQVIPESIPKKHATGYGLQAINDFGKTGYGGPCPPRGSTHRYVFLLLALDTNLELSPEATVRDVLDAARGHVVSYAIYYGLYRR